MEVNDLSGHHLLSTAVCKGLDLVAVQLQTDESIPSTRSGSPWGATGNIQQLPETDMELSKAEEGLLPPLPLPL